MLAEPERRPSLRLGRGNMDHRVASRWFCAAVGTAGARLRIRDASTGDLVTRRTEMLVAHRQVAPRLRRTIPRPPSCPKSADAGRLRAIQPKQPIARPAGRARFAWAMAAGIGSADRCGFGPSLSAIAPPPTPIRRCASLRSAESVRIRPPAIAARSDRTWRRAMALTASRLLDGMNRCIWSETTSCSRSSTWRRSLAWPC